MKKIKYIAFLVLFLIPIMVKGDMAAPMSSYKVRISNPSGAVTYEWNSDKREYVSTDVLLAYDEVYDVMYEQIINGELYGYATIKTIDENGWNANKDYGYIKLSDTSPLEINLDDFKKENKIKYYVFDNSCYLYKGPSRIYGKIEPEIYIKEGTIIESNIYDDMWMYIEYNGVKGWVYRYTYLKESYGVPAGLAYVNENKEYNRKLYTMKEIELYKSPKAEEKTGKTIPKGATLDYIYRYSMQPFSPNYYVSYNGSEGWIKPEQDIYSDAVITNFAYYNTSTLKIKSETGLKFYSTPDENSDVVGVVSNGSEVTSKYSLEGGHMTPWYYISYEETEGWLYVGFGENVEYISRDSNPQIGEIEEPGEDTPEVIISEEKNEENRVSETIIYYLAGAAILCLTAAVTLMLVNKKKKSKKEEIKTEIKESEEKTKEKDESIPVKK